MTRPHAPAKLLRWVTIGRQKIANKNKTRKTDADPNPALEIIKQMHESGTITREHILAAVDTCYGKKVESAQTTAGDHHEKKPDGLDEKTTKAFRAALRPLAEFAGFAAQKVPAGKIALACYQQITGTTNLSIDPASYKPKAEDREHFLKAFREVAEKFRGIATGKKAAAAIVALEACKP
jgi:hypothetical protein